MTLSPEEFRYRLPIWKMLIVIRRKGPSNPYDVYLGDRDEIFRSPSSYYKKLKEAEELGLVKNISNSTEASYRLTSKGLEETERAEKLFSEILS